MSLIKKILEGKSVRDDLRINYGAFFKLKVKELKAEFEDNISLDIQGPFLILKVVEGLLDSEARKFIFKNIPEVEIIEDWGMDGENFYKYHIKPDYVGTMEVEDK